jgi:uncharacterized membrane protein YccC
MAVGLDRSQLKVVRGVRNAVGVVIPLAVGIATDEVAAGVAIAGGALLVGFVDVGAGYASRARVMLLCTGLVGVSVFVGTLAGGVEWLLCILMLIWGFCAGLSVSLGRAPSLVMLNAALGLLLAAFFSGDLADSLDRAGLTIVGGLLQTGLALATWPLAPSRPEREAVAHAYRALADFVDAMAAGAPTDVERPKLSAATDPARELLDDAEGRAQSTTEAGEAFRTLMIEADRVYPEAIALAHERAVLPAPAAAATLDALEATASALRAIAGELGGGGPARTLVESLRARLRAATTAIGTDGGAPGLDASARLESLRAQLRSAAEAASAWSGRDTLASMLRRPVVRRPALIAHAPLAILRANLSLSSPAFRHGVRLGVTLAVATALYRVLDLPRGYWVPLTVAFVLRPDFGGTFTRGAQRYAGTIVGVVTATALTALLDPGDWTLVALVGVFAVGVYALLFANYALFTGSVTALIVFFVAFDGVSEWTAVTDRLLDTIIGGALSLIAFALWPTWEGERVAGRVADLIDADRRYVGVVLGACVDPTRYDHDTLHERRVLARRTRTQAEASLALAQAEPHKHRGDVDAAVSVLTGLRRLADGALALEAFLEDAAARVGRPELGTLTDDLDAALVVLAEAERNGGHPPPLPALRAEHDALAGSEPADSLVVQETDGMVHAITTLDTLLRA